MIQRVRFGWELVSKTLERFSKHRGDLLAAALAFHTLLSMAPLIIVAVAVAGLALGQGTAQAEVERLLSDSIGRRGASAVNEWVQQASANGAVASIVGLGLSLLAASRFATQLRSALDQVWSVDVQTTSGLSSSVKSYLGQRLSAFALTLAAGPVLLVVFMSRTLLTGFHETLFAGAPGQGVIVQITQLLLSVSMVAVVSGLVFRYVPDERVPWRHALLGGVVTSVLFNIGNALVGIYLGRASVSAAYGAAGSLVVVLLWLYFSAQFFLVGAAFTREVAERSRSMASDDARAARPRGHGRAAQATGH